MIETPVSDAKANKPLVALLVVVLGPLLLIAAALILVVAVCFAVMLGALVYTTGELIFTGEGDVQGIGIGWAIVVCAVWAQFI